MPRTLRLAPAPLSNRLVVVIAASVGLLGCRGDKIATVVLAGPGTAEVRFASEKTVTLWSDWEGEWKGGTRSKLQLAYEVEVLQAGILVGKVGCDTISVLESVCSGGSNEHGNRKDRCEVQMKCELPDTMPGEITLRVTGRLLEPATTKSVTKMNVNVRLK